MCTDCGKGNLIRTVPRGQGAFISEAKQAQLWQEIVWEAVWGFAIDQCELFGERAESHCRVEFWARPGIRVAIFGLGNTWSFGRTGLRKERNLSSIRYLKSPLSKAAFFFFFNNC